MKKMILLLTLFVSCLCFSQGKAIEAEVITINGDTLITDIFVRTNIFYGEIREEFLIWGIKIGKETGINASYIKKMSLTDFKGKRRIFVNSSIIQYTTNKLVELMYDGNKIKWYRDSYPKLNGDVLRFEIFVDENDKIVYNGQLNNRKKQLKKMTASKPELAEEIDNTKFGIFYKTSDPAIVGILQKYDAD